ncbi:MAG: SP_1767 family glycosyltransferase [Bacteroides sp.]|nr:SP_1767 family glycosyltransferase [Bacteroides sp.]
MNNLIKTIGFLPIYPFGLLIYKALRNQFPLVLSSKDTLELLIKTKKSLSRFGDGELNFISGRGIGFQCPNQNLAIELNRVLMNPNNNCLIAIPDVFHSLKRLNIVAKCFWLFKILTNWKKWKQSLCLNQYCDSLVSRFYIDLNNKKSSVTIFELWRKLWDKRDVVIIEGEKTKMGVGNDMFSNTSSISRIICPSKNAFDVYPKIVDAAKKSSRSSLILIALGPTASILANDLSAEGFQAIDCGHLDLEYNWMISNSKKKTSIPGRAINELNNDSIEDINDNIYLSQIIAKIGID